ncbi:hypothetical protein BH10CHL1_BH10CHL1_32880 [soil metagenome]
MPQGAADRSPVEVMYDQAELTKTDRPLHEMVQELGKLPLVCQPGSKWQYGLSTDVLGHLVEVLADMPLDAFLAQRIFSPLGMQDTEFFVSLEKLDRLAVVYEPVEDGGLARLDIPDTNQHLQPGRYLSGGGGLTSTTTDYLRFAQMLLNRGEKAFVY